MREWISVRGKRPMSEKQLMRFVSKIAMKYKTAESVRRSDVIREVVRTHKLNLDDSLIAADCIVKGLYAAGKTVVVA